jgi:hypothetical protein
MRKHVLVLAMMLSGACDLGKVTVGTTAKVLVRAQPSLQMESDYQLAHDAIPGALKTIEGFWIVDPDNQDLIGILTEGYCQYGTAFVEDEWETAKLDKKLDAVAVGNARSTHIFMRCLNYALKTLGERWQKELFADDPQVVVKLIKETGKDQRTPMMWAGLALGSILNHNLDRPEALAYLSTVKLILARLNEIDGCNAERTDCKSAPENAQMAALPHVAQGMVFSAAGAQFGGDAKAARSEFELALKLTATKDVPEGRLLLARALMGYRVGLMTNDRKFFHEQLKKVLETAPSVWPEQRLANEVAHRRARRYLTHEKELF